MAATAITPLYSINRSTAQVAETNGDTANGNSFTNDGRTLLFYRNAGATPRTFVVVTSATAGVDSLAVADVTVTVAASSDWVPLGFFDPAIYGTTVTITSVSSTDVRFKAGAFA